MFMYNCNVYLMIKIKVSLLLLKPNRTYSNYNKQDLMFKSDSEYRLNLILFRSILFLPLFLFNRKAKMYFHANFIYFRPFTRKCKHFWLPLIWCGLFGVWQTQLIRRLSLEIGWVWHIFITFRAEWLLFILLALLWYGNENIFQFHIDTKN